MPAAQPAKPPFDVLVCPLCVGDTGDLTLTGRSLVCSSRHTFDFAKQGYVSLLGGSAHAPDADTADMVRARADFLGAGHYAPLLRELADRAKRCAPTDARVLDAGTGTGAYLSTVLDVLPDACGLGLDASKYAVRRAARAHPRAGAATWDLWQPLPVRTASVDLLLNVFAPRNGGEYHRVLRPSGALVVVTPTSGHLVELRESMGLLNVDETKAVRLERSLSAHFELADETLLEHAVSLTPRDVTDLVLMGPTARHHTAEEVRDRAARLPEHSDVRTSFRLATYHPR